MGVPLTIRKTPKNKKNAQRLSSWARRFCPCIILMARIAHRANLCIFVSQIWVYLRQLQQLQNITKRMIVVKMGVPLAIIEKTHNFLILLSVPRRGTSRVHKNTTIWTKDILAPSDPPCSLQGDPRSIWGALASEKKT